MQIAFNHGKQIVAGDFRTRGLGVATGTLSMMPDEVEEEEKEEDSDEATTDDTIGNCVLRTTTTKPGVPHVMCTCTCVVHTTCLLHDISLQRYIYIYVPGRNGNIYLFYDFKCLYFLISITL